MIHDKYDVDIFDASGALIAFWNGHAFAVGEYFKNQVDSVHTRSGVRARRHGGPVLLGGKIYTVKSDGHPTESEAVVYLGYDDTDGPWEPEVNPYGGMRSMRKARPLFELDRVNPDKSVSCKTCHHREEGVDAEGAMVEHINDQHITDGEIDREAATEMYQVK